MAYDANVEPFSNTPISKFGRMLSSIFRDHPLREEFKFDHAMLRYARKNQWVSDRSRLGPVQQQPTARTRYAAARHYFYKEGKALAANGTCKHAYEHLL